MKILLLALSIVFFGSCAFHSGQWGADVPNEPVQHVDIAVGAATSTKVFGFGGLAKDALVFEGR